MKRGSISIREMARETGLSPATLCRVGQGKHLDYPNTIKILRYLNPDLADEADAAINYLRLTIKRRAKP